MNFNVARLMKAPSGSGRVFRVDESVTFTEDASIHRVVGRVGLLRTDKGVWVSATLGSQALCACSRCLKEYWQPVTMTIEEECFPVVDILTGTRLPPPEDGEENFHIDPNHILDLTEAVRQYFALSIPMKPVCREDCAGICPTCGSNRNEDPCGCSQSAEDPRWGTLRSLIPTTTTSANRKS